MNTEDTPNGPMLVGSSPDRLASLLEEFGTELLRLGFPADALRPPVERDYVSSELRSRRLGVPDEVLVWFGWHSGNSRINGHLVPLPTATLATFEESLKQYDAMIKDFHDRGVPTADMEAEAWGAPRGWLRLEDSSEAISVECVTEGSIPPRVRYASIDFVEIPDGWNRAVSLCTPVAFWIEACRDDQFEWDAGARAWRVLKPLEGKLTHSVLG